jgi:NlpC/P60 family putative phage cell wall peptidase
MSAMREAVVAAARRWIGTPYRHQASVQGVGTDCLGLVRGVWREVTGEEPERAPAYTPDWAEALGEETLLRAARRHLREIPIGEALAGDVLLFRMAMGSPAKHAAIVSGERRIIHAYWGRAVCETRLVSWWERRIAAAFAWPEAIPSG